MRAGAPCQVQAQAAGAACSHELTAMRLTNLILQLPVAHARPGLVRGAAGLRCRAAVRTQSLASCAGGRRTGAVLARGDAASSAWCSSCDWAWGVMGGSTGLRGWTARLSARAVRCGHAAFEPSAVSSPPRRFPTQHSRTDIPLFLLLFSQGRYVHHGPKCQVQRSTKRGKLVKGVTSRGT
jgi:hypothetical protein